MESQKRIIGTPFEPGNPGKPKGAVNKVNRMVKDFVSDVFNALQDEDEAKRKKADLKSWAMENPKDFYNIAAKLIPVQMQHEGSLVINWHEELTDEADSKTEPSA